MRSQWPFHWTWMPFLADPGRVYAMCHPHLIYSDLNFLDFLHHRFPYRNHQMIDGNPYFNTSFPRSLLVRIFKLNPSAGPGDSPGNPTHNDSIIIQERNHSCISNDNGLVVKVVFPSPVVPGSNPDNYCFVLLLFFFSWSLCRFNALYSQFGSTSTSRCWWFSGNRNKHWRLNQGFDPSFGGCCWTW